MGFGGFLKEGLRAGFDTVTGGVTRLAGEDTLASVPGLREITGSRTDAEKALVEQQKKMSEQARQRAMQNEQMRMNALSQSVMAFNPRNQLMAKMFGPEAAFTPEQMAAMVKNPTPNELDPSLFNYQGTDPNKQREVEEYLKKKKADEARQQQVLAQMSPLPQGPAPMAPMQAAPPRRF